MLLAAIILLSANGLLLAALLIQQQRNQKQIMKTQAELAAELAALNDQQKKIAKEQADRFDAQTKAIAALEEAVRNAPVAPEVETALAGLHATTDALDATIPDAPV